MRMTADYDVDSRRRRVEVEGIEIVQHVDQGRAGVRYGGLRQIGAPCARVDISPDRYHRGKEPQFLQNPGVANVASMDDQVRALQGLHRFRAKQAVGIRNKPDNAGFLL